MRTPGAPQPKNISVRHPLPAFEENRNVIGTEMHASASRVPQMQRGVAKGAGDPLGAEREGAAPWVARAGWPRKVLGFGRHGLSAVGGQSPDDGDIERDHRIDHTG